MFKKSIIILGVLLCLFISVPAMAAINVTIDDKALVFEDVQPTIVSGRTMVPMRAIFEALGVNVEWNGVTQEITATFKDEFGFDNSLVLTINKTSAFLYGYRGVGEELTLDVPPMLINDRTMVPARFVAESLGATVNWIADTSTVQIISPSGTPATSTPAAPEANPELTFELTSGEYQGTSFVVDGVFTNTGNVKISQINKVSIKIYVQNDEEDSVLLADETFENIQINLAPGETDMYTFTFPDVTVYEDITGWTSEEYDWEYTLEE